MAAIKTGTIVAGQALVIVVNGPKALSEKMHANNIDPKDVFLKTHEAEYAQAVPEGHFRKARIRGTLGYEYNALAQLHAVAPEVFVAPVCKVVDWEEKTVGYMSQFVVGRRLSEYYRDLDGQNRQQSIGVIRESLRQVAKTIALIHSRSLVYGDFTTDNTLITGKSKVTLIDPDPLGLAPCPKDRDIRDFTALARGALAEGIITQKEHDAMVLLLRR